MEIHLGIDDTDSRQGMCTTYLASTIVNEVIGDFQRPELVRLNPNIPWKTRGNGALAIRGTTPNYSEFKEEVIDTVNGLREPSSNTGIVFFKKDPRKHREIRLHSQKAIKNTIDPEDAVKLARKHGEIVGFGNKRGVVGALAAAGHTFNDMTLELLAYRERARWGTPRKIDKTMVYKASELHPLIWDTVDWKHKKIVIKPNSPCPVLYGIRGDHEKAIKKAHNTINSEPISHTTIFKTNQGTDEHITPQKIGEAKPMSSSKVVGEVVEPPKTIEGGHVIFKIKDSTGEIDCAAYEPTKKFRNKVRKLIKGDTVVVYGGITKSPPTINIEKFKLKQKKPKTKYVNPTCPSCGRNMKSAGKNQGYRCKKCKTTKPKKIKLELEREIEEGFYEVPPIARRHLAKPLIRMEMGYDQK
ncbi:tRNA(Ile)(2)-agmatinylcytidine synthase [Methanonatronarchaeum sp. AMET-Sl]|uniref:tRNA(Ile)(2)-agmatinylcytidine synthase n=1 Tax=Methanonatronarchaeum sp. AMET-Sl TaxID=3037654 RepID=UPI00244DDEF2|nr:tRNA(Ile)(2)-agmatinylcytidine synthase [Methanonatronarchaeum sp. AMET-Sl]WGI17742.1 tRNA(Ile)(2)-agmatinylcytidine synthase [Methanonatronarchaeum sp. AMET-Sl]